MNLKFATNQVSSYKVSTPVYEGPLDLLLQLIENAELDITSLALAQVTDQYLEHMKHLKHYAAEEVSAFMVIAAKLLQIKSEALLPRPPKRDPEEIDIGDELARQLLAYKRYKEIADLLSKRKEQGLQSYSRLAPPPKVKDKVDLGEFSLQNLIEFAQKALQEAEKPPPLDTVVARPKVTVREKIFETISTLKQKKRVTFKQLLGSKYTRTDVVVSFLAILELIKRRYVKVRQEILFDDFVLEPANELNLEKEEQFDDIAFN